MQVETKSKTSKQFVVQVEMESNFLNPVSATPEWLKPLM